MKAPYTRIAINERAEPSSALSINVPKSVFTTTCPMLAAAVFIYSSFVIAFYRSK